VRLWTIGHSNHTFDVLLAALVAHEISLVADVRRYPTSRRHPHFSRTRLEPALHAQGIGYLHMPDLGGHREPRPDSVNTAIGDAVFRGYADHMETAAFADAVERLLEAAAHSRVAVMCAERAWTDCHRGYIADDLKARGHDVVHIVSPSETEPHPYTAAARLVDGKISYRGWL
jgi:uncharacterized protein (DUF488 family)